MDDYGPFSTAEAKDSHGFYVNMTGAVSDVPPAPRLKTYNQDGTVTEQIFDRALDRQVGGDHYKNFKIQPIEFIEANNLGFSVGNIVKYACRHQSKGGKKDLEKVIHYAQLLIELEYGK